MPRLGGLDVELWYTGAMRGWRLARSSLSMAVLGALCSACPPTHRTTTTAEEAPGLEESDFLGELVQASCRGLAQCCGRASLEFSKSRCEYAVRTAMIQTGVPRSTETVSYDAEAATACVSEVEALMASCVDWQNSVPLSCAAAFSGSLPPSATCIKEDDCAVPPGGAATCVVDAMQQGTCTVRTSGAVNNPCVASCWTVGGVLQCEPAVDPYVTSTTICLAEDGLFCGPSGGCRRLLGRGEACRTSADCQGGLYCEATRGQCVPRTLVGNACSQADACVSDARCAESGLCVTGQPDGATCDELRVCEGLCDAWGTCQASAVRGFLAPFMPTNLLCSPPIPEDGMGGL